MAAFQRRSFYVDTHLGLISLYSSRISQIMNSAQKVTGRAAEVVPPATGRLGVGSHQRASCPRSSPSTREGALS